MGKHLLSQKPVVSNFGLFYIIVWLTCQKFGLFVETTGFETTGFSPYKRREAARALRLKSQNLKSKISCLKSKEIA